MHSKVVGGSTAARVIACPPSRILCQGIAERQDSPDSIRGTSLHKAVQMLGTAGAAPEEAGAFVGAVVENYLITEADVMDALLPAYVAFIDYPWGEHAVLMEHAVKLPMVHEEAGGTLDLFGIHADGSPVVADWKFGKGIQVFPTDNKQLLYYAAGAYFDKTLQQHFKGKKEVVLLIIQPNDRGLPIVREHRVPLTDLFDFTVQLRNAVMAGDKAELAIGEHCRFCPAKLICPAHRKVATELPPVNRDTVRVWLELIPALEATIHEARQFAYDYLSQGEQIQGFKLVDSQPRRHWKDETKAVKRFKALGLTKEVTSEPTLMSPAQVEKALKGLPPEVEDLIERRSGSKIVVPETDSRPAVTDHRDALRKLAERIK